MIIYEIKIKYYSLVLFTIYGVPHRDWRTRERETFEGNKGTESNSSEGNKDNVGDQAPR